MPGTDLVNRGYRGPLKSAMGRQPRFVVPDLPVHIVQRGNDRMPCFQVAEDYLVYLALLRSLMAKAGRLHAFCLMTNHVHLLLSPVTVVAISALMRALAHRYAQYFNRKYSRTGSLWEGRYRSCVVESDSYVLACTRYIELNPVRAGMVSQAGLYPWSSYPMTIGERTDPLVTVHESVAAIGADQYKRLVTEEIDVGVLREIRDSTSGGYPLASAGFKAKWSIAAKRAMTRSAPGPKDSSVPGTDLFSGGGVS